MPGVSRGADGKKNRSYQLTLWSRLDTRDLSWGMSVPVGRQVAGRWPCMARSSVVRANGKKRAQEVFTVRKEARHFLAPKLRWAGLSK